MKHRWKKDEDILVFYLYRYGDHNGMNTYLLNRGIPQSSVPMRIANFRFLDGKGGLEKYAKLSEAVYREYKDYSKERHLQRCLEIMRENE